MSARSCGFPVTACLICSPNLCLPLEYSYRPGRGAWFTHLQPRAHPCTAMPGRGALSRSPWGRFLLLRGWASRDPCWTRRTKSPVAPPWAPGQTPHTEVCAGGHWGEQNLLCLFRDEDSRGEKALRQRPRSLRGSGPRLCPGNLPGSEPVQNQTVTFPRLTQKPLPRRLAKASSHGQWFLRGPQKPLLGPRTGDMGTVHKARVVGAARLGHTSADKHRGRASKARSLGTV